MARLRQPGSAARAFIVTLAATEARLRVRARRARRPCRARAMPRLAKTRAAASGIAASRAAMAGRWRVALTMRYWAVKLTAAAAAASTPRPAAAVRSHRADGSGAGCGLGEGPMPGTPVVRARGKAGARARAPVVRGELGCRAPAMASVTR